MFRTVIEGTGSFLPQNALSNDDLSKTLDTSDEWIQTRTGICQRHIAKEGEYTSDLAVYAAQKALDSAGITPDDIDLIVLATATPDHTFPSTATRIQSKMGIHRGAAFDISAVCSGYIYALVTADLYLQKGLATRALVIGAETFSRLIDWSDRRTAVLFGDGAGATILKAVEVDTLPSKKGVLGHVLRSNGDGYDALMVSGGPSTGQNGFIKMNGREVFRHAITCLESVSKEVLEQCNIGIEGIDWMVPHQANKRIIDAVSERINFPSDRVIHTGSMHANTSSASIPLALDVAIRDGRIQEGHTLLLGAFGAGFAWGACVISM